ncbi:MAG: diaminopimelate epimerase, partial [Gemmataceae bacterium]|nr:diaminopimelate epimerase [Gemmataceae bacterium]
DHGIARKPRLTIETGRGVLAVELEVRNDKVSRVRVDMGEPILESARIPTTLPGNPPIRAPLLLGTRRFEVTCVSMGNPHVVIYATGSAGTDSIDEEAQRWGPRIELAPEFPRRTNVHFVVVHSPSEVTMRTWERGSGITRACGTGACAVCVAGVLTDRTGRNVLAHLPGGDLVLEWSAGNNHVFMTGPASEVFAGDWPW